MHELAQDDAARDSRYDEPAGGHPMFPLPPGHTGPDLRPIDLIHLERFHEDGTKEVLPTPLPASEIRSWADVVARFGGGVYVARAQCAKTHRFQAQTARMTFSSPPPRPFTETRARPRATGAGREVKSASKRGRARR